MIDLEFADGTTAEHGTNPSAVALTLHRRNLVGVSRVAALTSLLRLHLTQNQLAAVPPDVFAMTQLRSLNLAGNRIAALPPAIVDLTRLEFLSVSHNQLQALPAALGRLTALTSLLLDRNGIAELPHQLAQLQRLRTLSLHDNRVAWLPVELAQLPLTTGIHLHNNPLPLGLGEPETNSRERLDQIFAASTHIGMIRRRAAEICIAMAELDLPALLTLKILNAAMPNKIRMAATWDLVVVVKHWRQRYCVCEQSIEGD